MSEDAPELTAELVVDGVVPSQPVISPTGAGLPASPLRPGQGPHSGDDTYDLIGHALRQLAGRRGAWPGGDLTAITLTASLIDQAGRFLPELVTSARLNGHTLARHRPGPGHQPRRGPPAMPAPTPRPPTAAGPTTPETAKAGPLQAATTAPNPHPAGARSSRPGGGQIRPS